MNKNGAVGDGNSQLIEVLPARFAGTRTDEPKKFTIQVALDGKHLESEKRQNTHLQIKKTFEQSL